MATPAGVIATMIARRQFLQFAGVGVAAPFVPQVACAEAWPARRIKVIVPILAGTGVDILSRLVLNELATRLGQPIVIDNRPGATGTIGAAAVAKADADGYTILTDSSAHTIVPSLYLNLPYDPVRDFSPVIPLGTMPFVLVCAPSKSFKTLEELITTAQARPGMLNYASGGIGTANHLATERFRLSAGFEAVHVPFRGAGSAGDLLSGRIDFAFSPLGPVLDLIQDGRLLALAVNGRKRAALLPDVPTMVEAGYADSDANFWVGMFVPVKTPRAIVDKLNRETIKVVSTPGVQEHLAKITAEPMIMSPAEFEAMIAREFVANASLAKSIGLTAN